MKTEVYSWRVSVELKSGLEREAHRRKMSLSALLDLAARDWLSKDSFQLEGEEKQLKLQQAASKCLGVLDGGNLDRSQTVRQIVRQRLNRRHDT